MKGGTVDATEALQHYESIRTDQEDFYKDLHQNPELSHQEHRTAANVVRSMSSYGFQRRTGSEEQESLWCCTTAAGQRSCFARTWTRCPCRNGPAQTTQARS